MPKLILETPRERSRKAIGTSTTRKFLPPWTRTSNAILKPVAAGASSSSSFVGSAKNPPIESCTPVSG